MSESDRSEKGSNTSQLQNGVRALRAIEQALGSVFPQVTGNSSSATGGAATLPANPVGFLTITNPSTGGTVKVPYYDE